MSTPETEPVVVRRGPPLESKPGVRTTEFWVTVFTNILMILNLAGAWDYMPDRYSGIVIAVVNGAYAVARGVAKIGPSYQPTNLSDLR